MSLKPTILIVKSNLDDLRKAKEEIIQKAESRKQLVKYSDTAVELYSKLYIFKAITLPYQILDAVRGYAEIEAEDFLTDLDKFVETIRNICSKKPDTSPSTPSKATGGSPRGAKVEDDVDDPNDQNNSPAGDK